MTRATPSDEDDDPAPRRGAAEGTEPTRPRRNGAVERRPGPDLERCAERDQYLDALQRLKAEFDNFRKRNDRERQMIATGATREWSAGCSR